jgi:protein translocase SEC61 complex gamma subunit
MLIKRCTKPDAKEFKKIAIATTVGFLIMGAIGFFVKLNHIPINNILVRRLLLLLFAVALSSVCFGFGKEGALSLSPRGCRRAARIALAR